MIKPILDPVSELVIFFGNCGAGKSSLMLHFVNEYLKTQGKARWELSEKILREQNAERKKPLSFPDRPPIYSNLKLKLTRNGREFLPFDIKGKDTGISNANEKYKAIYPASLLVFDEAHSEFCSKGDTLPAGQRDFFLKRRHARLIILMAAPRAVLIHKDIRNSGARFIEVRGQKHEYDVFNRIYKTTWRCREFSDKSALEEYITTDGKSGTFTEKTYEHNGNVFNLYDSFTFAKDFMPTEGKDFET